MNLRMLLCLLGLALGGFQPLFSQPLVRGTDRLAAFPAAPPRNGYSFTDALPGLTFSQPVAITTPPGETNRLFVVEKTGRIIVVTNLASPTRTVFLALTNSLLTAGEQGVLGLAFHPRYAQNGRFFVYRTVSTGPDGVRSPHDVLSEFRVTPTNANVALPPPPRSATSRSTTRRPTTTAATSTSGLTAISTSPSAMRAEETTPTPMASASTRSCSPGCCASTWTAAPDPCLPTGTPTTRPPRG